MPRLIPHPTQIPVPGGKIIHEYLGRVNSDTEQISIAHMQSPPGWTEPGQTPEFDEYTLVLRGTLHLETRDGVVDVRGGQAVLVQAGEWVRYSTPGADGAEYVAICLPAFSLQSARRDPQIEPKGPE